MEACGLATEARTILTGDGVALKARRYVNEGAQPVLLLPGFSFNGCFFELPHARQNLALYLAAKGYDVWVASFRGCGRDWSHSIDHLAALDLPALVRAVNEATGKPLVCLGHSMGGTVIYWYLLGARLEAVEGEGDGDPRVVLDESLREERHRSILGGVTICGPAGWHHPGRTWLGLLSRLPRFEALTKALPRLLRRWSLHHPRIALSRGASLFQRMPRLGRLLARCSPLAYFLGNPRNLDTDVVYSLLKYAGEDVTTRMACQIISLGHDPDYRDYRGELNYTAHMHLVKAPFFFITGTGDFVGEDNLRHAHDLVSSELKRFKSYPGYGHTDLVVGKRVQEEVYPDILAWIEDLCAAR
jgi:pimeloyl-ACP methyl ester carboxylesterase